MWATRNDPVLFLHGIWMNRHCMLYLVHALRKEGYRASALGYRAMREGIEGHVSLLAGRIAGLDAERIHLVGHSMGGIVALRYLQRTPDARVRRAVLLGSPVGGCAVAGAFASRAGGRWLLGRSLEIWRGPFDVSLAPGIEVGVIAGTRQLGLGRFFVRLPRPNDGVVCVDETRFPAMSDHISLPVAHSAMVVSPGVARQICAFLNNGAFSR